MTSFFHDEVCLKICRANINMAVPWYLMAAHAYYIEDDIIISDETFDRLARMLLKGYKEINHRHKEHIKISDLKAGTFLGTYPSMVPGAVKQLREGDPNE